MARWAVCYDDRMILLLVPGYMADATLWDDLVAPLTPFGPLVHADLAHDTTLAAMARRALENAPERFTLIGFSMGGYVAREIVRQAPERVKALALIATSTRPDSPSLRNSKAAVGRAAASVAFAGLSRTAIASSLHPERAHDTALIERVRMMGVRLGAAAFRQQSMLERDDDSALLGQITCPTLVVAASHDRLRSMDEAQVLHQGIAQSEFAPIDNCGHMIPLEAPDALAQVLVPWLARVSR